MQLENKRMVITGAARGIGLAVVEACLKEGAYVLATDIDSDELSTAAEKLAPFGQRLEHHHMDIRSEESVHLALEYISHWESIDGLVNNAAQLDISDASDLAHRHFTEVLDVNLTGALRVTSAALGKLRRAKHPSIINTLSTQAFFGVAKSAAYATAKGGLLMLTRSMAVDYGASNIRVNGVAPGFIDTRMAYTEDGEHEHKAPDFLTHYIEQGRIPLRRPGKAEDCAGTYVFLLSNQSCYITGQVICVDGGLTATY